MNIDSKSEKWKRDQLGNICHISSGGTPSKSNVGYWANGTIPWLRSECCKNEVVNKADIFITEDGLNNCSAKLLKSNTTLIALVGATIGKTAYIPFVSTTNQNVSGLYPVDVNILLPKYLFYACQSFFDRYFSGFSGFKMANLSFIKSLEIPIPPIEEQKQIASLFQSIETLVGEIEEQEKKLKLINKNLVKGLLNSKPEFGNLLYSNNYTAITFAEIAECDKRYPEHQQSVQHIVGLDHFEPENFQLQGSIDISKGTTFTKRFTKGDVLFGKRRAYLRKVAVADFDGVCSGDILVLRAKTDKFLQGLLPFYISSDAFIQHAVSTSAGSLSPRTKWKDLATLQVTIPDLETQEKILGILQQIESTVRLLKHQKTTLKQLKQKLLNEILG